MNKTVLISGSAKGLGKSMAIEFAKNNYAVVLNDLSENRESINTLKIVKKLSNKSDIYYFDVSDENMVNENCSKIIKKYRKIDVLINNAGIVRDKTLLKLPYADWDAVIKTNLYGPFILTRAVLPIMINNERGRIINISSIIGQVGNFGQTNYSAAKAGLIGLTKSLAKEVARYNITVNAICPGFLDTDMAKTIPKEILETRILPKIALNRLGKPEEIAKLAMFLASKDSDYITGETLGINGGWL
jgi:NAD(P)-dependent dehydrogenase (short-subunit alcohol dehydrogenase family)